jgi:hypothetical protein
MSFVIFYWYLLIDCVNHQCVHGQCVSNGGSYTCECDAGYSGDFCEECELVKTTSPQSYTNYFSTSCIQRARSSNVFLKKSVARDTFLFIKICCITTNSCTTLYHKLTVQNASRSLNEYSMKSQIHCFLMIICYKARLKTGAGNLRLSVWVNDEILDVQKMWQNGGLHQKIYLQVLQNDYKRTGYYNDYNINLAISFSN